LEEFETPELTCCVPTARMRDACDDFFSQVTAAELRMRETAIPR